MIRDFVKGFLKNKKISEEMEVFYIVHAVCVIGMLFMSFVVSYFIEDNRAIYLSFCIAILFLLTIFEAGRTGKQTSPVVVMSIIFNLIYLPIMFFMFDRYICAIPVYFIFGIIYTVMLLDIKLGLIIGAVEGLFYIFILIYGYRDYSIQIANLSEAELRIRYFATMVAVIVSGSCVGAATRLRYVYYQREQKKADKVRNVAMDTYVAKDMFLINMSHEIRTPMNAIVGAANLLLDKNINDRVSDSVYNILKSCDALLSITDGLMDLSKVESGEVELFNTAYDFDELLYEIINMMTVRLTESNINFYVDINKDIPKRLYGDVSKNRQLFVNLLNNAIKYTKQGKIILRVDYRYSEDSKFELIVDVEDTGCGIKKEKLDKLFVREADNNASVDDNLESSGIGLAICAEIVEKMHGSISVQSKYGTGSVFTFVIPQEVETDDRIIEINDDWRNNYVLIFEKDEEHTENTKNILSYLGIKCDVARAKADFERLASVNGYTHIFIANERYDEIESFINSRLITAKIVALVDIDDNIIVKNATSLLNRPLNIINISALFNKVYNNYVRDALLRCEFTCPHSTILVVDDNSTNLNVASSVIRKYGANVLTASSGRDCLRLIKEHDIDLIFLDYMMPEMNGIDTLNAIRAIPGDKYSKMPVVALTANVVNGAREMFLEAGFDEYLTKPIIIDKMERVMKRFLPKNHIEYILNQDKIDEIN